jgi:hypothetical protein
MSKKQTTSTTEDQADNGKHDTTASMFPEARLHKLSPDASSKRFLMEFKQGDLGREDARLVHVHVLSIRRVDMSCLKHGSMPTDHDGAGLPLVGGQGGKVIASGPSGRLRMAWLPGWNNMWRSRARLPC